MQKKFTTIRIPVRLKDTVYAIIEVTGEPLFLFENNCVDQFVQQEGIVEEKYKNSRNYSNENHIRRDAVLPLYLETGLMERLDNYRKKINETKSNCVIQALENSCNEKAEKLGLAINLEYEEGEKNE